MPLPKSTRTIKIVAMLKIFFGVALLAAGSLAQPAMATGISPPLLQCNKSVKKVEKIICKDSELMNLEEIMKKNYIAMMSSDIGADAKNEMLKKQKNWILSRNKCATENCVATFYKERIKEICAYPVLLGVYPNCAIVD
jgi:uncharacterized protein